LGNIENLDGSFGLPSGPPRRQFYVRNVQFSNVRLNKGRSIALQYCDGIQFNNVRCSDGSNPEYILTGSNYQVVADGVALRR
jgi:hypothetical protein